MLDDPNETPNKVQAPSTLSGVKPLMSQSSQKKTKGHQHDCNSDIFFVIFIQLVSLPPQLWNLKESSPTFGGEPFSHPLTPNQKKNICFHGLKNIRSTAKNSGFFMLVHVFFNIHSTDSWCPQVSSPQGFPSSTLGPKKQRRFHPQILSKCADGGHLQVT